MEAAIGKVIGRGAGGRWGQVHDFVPEEEEKLAERGRMVAVVGLEGEDGENEVEMVTVGRQILARLHEEYYRPTEGGVLEALKKAVRTAGQEFPQANLAAMALVGTAIYLVVDRGGGVWVKTREGEGWAVEPKKEGGLTGMSGWAKPDEVLVMGNAGFWENVSLGVVRAALASREMSETVETIAAVERGNENGGGEAAAAVRLISVEERKEIAVEKAPERETEPPELKTEEREPGEKKERKEWAAALKNKLPIPRFPVGGVYLGESEKKKRKTRTMYAGLGLLLVLVGFGAAGRVKQVQKDREMSVVNQQLEALEIRYRDAKALTPLNAVRSRQVLAEIQVEVGLLQEQGIKDDRLTLIQGEIGEVLGAASGIKKIQIEEVVNLGLVRDGMRGEKIKYSDNQLWVLDTEGDRIISVDPGRNNGEVVWGKSDLGDARMLAVYPGKLLVLSDKGLVECQVKGKCQVVVETDSNWKNIADIEMWSGNIYLLDTEAGQIFRYPAGEKGYGSRQEWVSSESQGGLSGATGMAIDGSIWVLSRDRGSLYKYTRGVKEEILITGLDGSVGQGAAVATSDEAEKIYISDPENNRILVLSKGGEYESQLVNEEMQRVTDLAVDEKAGRVYLAGGEKVGAAGL